MLRNISVRTRIMLMLLTVSLLASIVLGVLGSNYGRKVIRKEVSDQLNLVRSSKNDQMTTYFNDISHFVEVMGQDRTILKATQEFSEAFEKLGSDSLPKESSRRLNRYYDTFMDRLGANMDIKKDLEYFLPQSLEGRYLQYEYIVKNTNSLGEKENLKTVKDSSAYSKVHAKYHDFFVMLNKKYGFYDAFLINLQTGDVVYSVEKETDFASNLYTGPYRGSNLAELAQNLKNNSDLPNATWQDFAWYRPTYGAPVGFVGIPLTDRGRTIGALVFQISWNEINRIMSGGEAWEDDGLGKTGESFLVGPDLTMRSLSRLFVQDSLEYRNAIMANGASQEHTDRMFRYGTTILQQKIDQKNVIDAFNGNKTEIETTGYLGKQVLTTSAPLDFKGLDWVIVSEKDYDEFTVPVRDFNRRMLIQTIVLILIITLLAMWMSRRFVRPIKKLSDAAKKIIAGDSAHRVEIRSIDEFGELSKSFNTMVDEVNTQKEDLRQQSEFSSELLENFVPTEYAGRLKKGEKAFAQEYKNLTLILIDVAGFSELLLNLGPDQSVKILSDVMEAFDTSAEHHRIERIRTVGDSYFAACGLFEPRLDHTNRSVLFAKEAQQLIKQINLSHNIKLDVQVSLSNGNVIAGIIGNEKFSFDLWGSTVGEVFRMNGLDADGEIIVMDNVRERLVGMYEFEPHKQPLKNGNVAYLLKDK